jgi:hypothetical protein
MKVKVEKCNFKVDEVTIREPTVEDLIKAEKIAGGLDKEGNQFEFLCALISLIAEFDGRKLPYDEVKKLPMSVFLELSPHLSEIMPSEALQNLQSLSQEQQTAP